MKQGASRDYPLAVYIFFVVSGVFLTCLLSVRGAAVYHWAGWGLSFFIYLWAVFHFGLVDKIFTNLNMPLVLLSLVLSGYSVYQIYLFATPWWRGLENSPFSAEISNAVSIAMASGAFFVLFAFFYFGLHYMAEIGRFILKEMDSADCFYLAAACGVSAIVIFLLFQKTNVFYDAAIGRYDVVYTSDSLMHFVKNTFTNINGGENDIRQPLFGLLALPFSCLAWLLSACFPWIGQGYFVFFAVIQSILMHTGFVLLAHTMRYDTVQKRFFYSIAGISFTVLLNTLMLEQYVLAFFWLAVFLFGMEKKARHLPVLFIAAAGSLITSLFFYPFAFLSKDIKESVKNMVWTGLLFGMVLTVLGQLPLLAEGVQSIQSLMRFAGYAQPFLQKAVYYSHFVWGMFFAPGSVVHSPFERGRVSYQLVDVATFHLGGLCIIAMAFAGFLFSRKKKMVRISFCWILFSVFLLCGIGWGAKENGFILYSLYFFWAYLILCYEGALAVVAFAKRPATLFCVALLCGMAVINWKGLRDLIWFGLQFFPA